MSKQTFEDRLLLLKNKVGLQQLSLGADISTQQINRYIRGGSQPTIGPLIGMAKAAGVSVEWLATGVGEVDKELAADPTTESIIDIPVLGGSDINSTKKQQTAPIYFASSYLRNTLGFDTQNFYVHWVDTSENANGINKGDVILVDKNSLNGNGLFVVRIADNLQILKLLYLPGGDLQITPSRDPATAYVLSRTHQQDIEIVGSIVWQGGKI